MNGQFLEFKSDPRIEKYLISVLTELRINFVKNLDGDNILMSFDGDSDVKKSLVCGVINNFFKMRELRRRLPEDNYLAYYAFLGSVIGLEQVDDTAQIIDTLTDDVINIDGFYNFKLTSLAEKWADLGEITAKLYDKCENVEDVYALTVFMLGADADPTSTLVISDSALRWNNGDRIMIVPYCDDKKKDIVIR